MDPNRLFTQIRHDFVRAWEVSSLWHKQVQKSNQIADRWRNHTQVRENVPAGLSSPRIPPVSHDAEISVAAQLFVFRGSDSGRRYRLSFTSLDPTHAYFGADVGRSFWLSLGCLHCGAQKVGCEYRRRLSPCIQVWWVAWSLLHLSWHYDDRTLSRDPIFPQKVYDCRYRCPPRQWPCAWLGR